jgi:hypothetical protein
LKETLMKPSLILSQAAVAGALVLGSPLAFSADADATPPMELKYDGNARERPVTPVSGTCAVRILPPVDERQNKETIGAGFGGPLLTGEANRWVADGLRHLKDFGFAVEESAAGGSAGDGLAVKTTLTRAYTWPIGIKLFSMVAIKAQFQNKNGVLQEKFYRAYGDKTNMWGADSEFVTTLNYGYNNLLPAMAQDLVSLCKGSKVEAYTYAGPDTAVKK